jgi:iron complex transport system substrate-binding protein
MRSLLLLALVACSRTQATPPPATRIVAIGGTTTEIVFALGAGDRVVGVDTSTTFPPEATRLPQVGYQRQLAAEGILSLRPTLVLATTDAGPPATLEQLRSLGLRVVVVPAEPSRAAARARIEAIAGELGLPAAPVLGELDRELDAALAEVARQTSRPRVVFLYGRGGGTVMVSGAKTAAAEILAIAGLENAVSGYDGYKPLSGEALVAAAPDVIVVPSRALGPLGGLDGIARLPGIAETPAGKARRFVAVDDGLLLGFGPRLGQGVAELSRRVRAWN